MSWSLRLPSSWSVSPTLGPHQRGVRRLVSRPPGCVGSRSCGTGNVHRDAGDGGSRGRARRVRSEHLWHRQGIAALRQAITEGRDWTRRVLDSWPRPDQLLAPPNAETYNAFLIIPSRKQYPVIIINLYYFSLFIIKFQFISIKIYLILQILVIVLVMNCLYGLRSGDLSQCQQCLQDKGLVFVSHFGCLLLLLTEL